ncbi:hypothetical protein VTH82DRAFT_1110, partial [Thermothelomyces myriococcoides]
MTAAGEHDVRALLIPGQCDVREYGTLTDASGGPGCMGTAEDAEPDVQDGVRRIEAVTRTWSKLGLMVAYM